MKKIFMRGIIALGVFLSAVLPVSGDENAMWEVDGLLRRGLNKNFGLIQEKAQGLTPAERVYLLGSHEKSTGLPVAANLLVGLGAGSFIQGDTVGGALQLTAELASTAALFYYAYGPGIGGGVYSGSSDDSIVSYLNSTLAVMTATSCVYLGSRIFGVIRPFTFKSRYNRKLKDALGYGAAVSLLPAVAVDAQGKMTAALSVRF